MTSSNRSVSRRILKVLIRIVGAVAALIILVLSAACIIVRLDRTARKVSAMASEQVRAEVEVGAMRLSFLKKFPDVTFSVYNGKVITEKGDTLLSFDDLTARASYLPLLKRKFVIPSVCLEGLKVDARGYRDGSVNWDIFPPDTCSKEKEDTTAFTIPEIHLGRLSIGAPLLSFRSPNYNLSASLFTSLSADNTPGKGLCASLKEFDFYSEPLHADITAEADSILSDDPHFKVQACIKAHLDRMEDYIPEQFKVGGNIVIDITSEALLSQLCLERFPGATVEASIVADQVNLLAPEENLAAHIQEPCIRLHSPAGKPLFADISLEKILFKSGATKVLVKDMDMKALAGGDPEKIRQRREERRRERGLEPRPRRADGAPREIPDFLSEPDFRLSDIHFDIDRSVSDLILKLQPVGGIDLDQAIVITPSLPLRNKVDDLSVRFDTDEFTIKSLSLQSGTSDISAQGYVSGLGRMLSGHGVMRADIDLTSGRLNINELLAAIDEGNGNISATADSLDIEALEQEIAQASLSDTDFTQADTITSTSSLIVVPANLIADISIDAAKVDYSSVEVNGFHTDLKMQERCLQINDLKAYSDICDISLNAFYSTRTKEKITAGFDLGLYDITADKVIELIPAVDEVLPMLSSFKGDLNCELAATSQLDTNMNFILPTLEGIFKISGQDLVLDDLGDMKKIARLLLFKDKEHGRIHDMSVNGTISDSQIQIYPFLLGIDRYAFGLKGTQGFNGKFRYHVSLIDTPLPLKIGVNLYGPDFDHIRWNLGRARYRTTKLPALYDEVDDMQINLATSIRNIFSRGVESAVREHRSRLEKLEESEETKDSGLEMEPLSEEEEALFEELTLFSEIDDLTADIINDIIAGK